MSSNNRSNSSVSSPDLEMGASSVLKKHLGKSAVIMSLVGIPVGSLLAVGLFAYYRREPVNVLTVFAVLAALPALLTLISALLLKKATKSENRSKLTSADNWDEASDFQSKYSQDPEDSYEDSHWLYMRMVAPVVKKLERWFNRKLKEGSRRVTVAKGFVMHPYVRVRMHFGFQCFGASTMMSASIVFFGYVLVHDVGFGWSSTVFANPSIMERFVAAASIPWSWATDAGPSADVIAGTQWSWTDNVFRDDFSSAGDRRIPQQWWKFLLLSVLAWGVLPRLVLMAITLWLQSFRFNKAPKLAQFGPAPESSVERSPTANIVAPTPPDSTATPNQPGSRFPKFLIGLLEKLSPRLKRNRSVKP